MSGVFLFFCFLAFQTYCQKKSPAQQQVGKYCILPLSIAPVSDTQMNQSLARLVFSKLSVGLWPHRLLDHLQRKVRLCKVVAGKEVRR